MSDETQQGDGQFDATRGDGVQPADLGYAPPNPGLGESADSEIPTGVDALTDEQIQTAQENVPSGGDEGGDEGGADGAIDVAALMDSGDADAAGDDGADASGGDDADASGGDIETKGAAADDAGDDATEMTEPAAQVAPDTGEA